MSRARVPALEVSVRAALGECPDLIAGGCEATSWGGHGDAERRLLRQVELEPGNALAIGNLGHARALQGRHREAVAATSALWTFLRGIESGRAVAIGLSGFAGRPAGRRSDLPDSHRPLQSPRQ